MQKTALQAGIRKGADSHKKLGEIEKIVPFSGWIGYADINESQRFKCVRLDKERRLRLAVSGLFAASCSLPEGGHK